MRMEMTPARRLALSGLLGAAVAVGAGRHLAGERRRLSMGQEMGEALVARRYIAAGRPVSADAVERRRVPRAYIEPGALQDEKEAAGGRARVALVKGEQVTRSKVELAGARPGLAWVVPPGYRALGLRLPTEHVASGHVNPGDRVDLLAVPRRERAEPARVLVRRARVLSVADRVWDPAEAPVDASAATGAAESLLVSLQLTADDVARVAASAERDTLMLALASPLGDVGPTEAP